MPSEIPLVDLAAGKDLAAEKIGLACREHGFFYISGHGVSEDLQRRLETQSRAFFARPLTEKNQIRMDLGGRAWRGYFPVGGELTSGKPDQKEGIYFGKELPASELPFHGPNLFPEGMRDTVLEYTDAMTTLGHQLMSLLSLSLGLPENYFHDHYTKDPLILFRIFNYPQGEAAKSGWGVGEHTDYGVLTILKQDDLGGLEVRKKGGWIQAQPIPNTFVCNIGDMLDRMTGGLYRSTPHRVRNVAGKDRLSFPFFFDPGYHTKVERLPIQVEVTDDKTTRWDGTSVHEFQGTYGEYLLGKVSKVFPQLTSKVL